ncbi:aminodeoxychorismate lyase [Idiomarina piscisalsi]|uniref:Endolytic murein transglycosylase n=1 Tax=Idiomarina piscisalsi TaxID=1096243 RepID=A0ABM6LT36_9GAMM|nr:endolytic transglycosylase MltG [Idiomarina piscisalsi]ASG65730.1 aminodeoxychorismate lyase [Idiomarina piscisalsi]
MTLLKRLFVIAFFFGVIGAGALSYGYYYLSQPFTSSSVNEPLILEFPKGKHARYVITQVSKHYALGESILDNKQLRYGFSRLLGGVSHLRAGVYEVKPEHNWFDVWSMVSNGDELQFSVTLVEGHTLQQWLFTLNSAPYLSGDAKSAANALQESLGPTVDSLEGLLLPETYTYRAYSTVSGILKNAYESMQKTLADVWSSRSEACPVESPYELLILASIIEKETGISGERSLVASVFANRLAIGMRLQSDPTTIYGIEDFDGNLTRAHLREKTAYNTYRINGLPPTPIAMPSKASLEAAANPDDSPFYYFVADDTGGHVFSETLEEHNKAVRRYQLNKE